MQPALLACMNVISFQEAFGSVDKVRRDIEEAKQKLSELSSPIVFCHNDLLVANFIYDEDAGMLLGLRRERKREEGKERTRVEGREGEGRERERERERERVEGLNERDKDSISHRCCKGDRFRIRWTQLLGL